MKILFMQSIDINIKQVSQDELNNLLNTFPKKILATTLKQLPFIQNVQIFSCEKMHLINLYYIISIV